MTKIKFYRSNLLGSYTVAGVGDIPPAPTLFKTDDPELITKLDTHPSNGSRWGFSEIPEPQREVRLTSDGQVKKKKKKKAETKEDQPVEKPAEKPADGLQLEEVTNLQLARKYLVDNYDELDKRKLTNGKAIENAAESVGVTFPNWNSK